MLESMKCGEPTFLFSQRGPPTIQLFYIEGMWMVDKY